MPLKETHSYYSFINGSACLEPILTSNTSNNPDSDSCLTEQSNDAADQSKQKSQTGTCTLKHTGVTSQQQRLNDIHRKLASQTHKKDLAKVEEDDSVETPDVTLMAVP